MKCNLILGGFAKCGTSSLHEYLNLHPEICMSSPVKEPHYFSVSEKYQRGPDWHDTLFSHAEESVRIFGESSTTYSAWEPALVKAKHDLDNPKLILVLREPLERLLSHYRWMYALGLERLPLEQALSEETKVPASPETHRNGCYTWYRRMSNYSQFVPMAQMIFGEENVLLLKSVDLAKAPREVLGKCFNFLNVGPYDIGDIEIRSNKTSEKCVERGTGLGALYRLLPRRIQQAVLPIRRSIVKARGQTQLVAPEPSKILLDELEVALEADRKQFEEVVL